MKHFENLTAEELLTIENAVPQIAILVAGADGVIDADEKEWAKKLTHIRGFAGDKWLNDLYDQIDVNFSIQFNDMLKLTSIWSYKSLSHLSPAKPRMWEIGRASCRERV